MKKRRSSRRSLLNFEIPIVISIAVLMVILINVSNKKITELIISDTEVLFMQSDHDPNDQMHEDLANKISEFRPDVCKMIEIYDESFETLIRVQFMDDDTVYSEDITNYPDLIRLLKDHDDGHTNIEMGDTSEYIYFKWSESSDGDRFLFIIYTNKPIVRNMWVLNAICYLVLILVIVLLVKLSIDRYHERIRLYEKLSESSAL